MAVEDRASTRSDLGRAIVAVAYLEGDFVLSSGRRSRYYLDKYLFETRPDLLRGIAPELAAHLPAGVARIAGPELGAVALAAALSLETNLPFVIARPAPTLLPSSASSIARRAAARRSKLPASPSRPSSRGPRSGSSPRCGWLSRP